MQKHLRFNKLRVIIIFLFNDKGIEEMCATIKYFQLVIKNKTNYKN